MPNLWNSISEKVSQALPEGERYRFVRDVRGYVSHQGGLVIHASDHELLTRIRQDYGALLSRAAQSAGLAGAVGYVEESAQIVLDPLAVADFVMESDPLTQLSLFDSPRSAVSTERQELAEPIAALRVSSFQDAREAMERHAPYTQVPAGTVAHDVPQLSGAALESALQAASLSRRYTLQSWVHGQENHLVFRAAHDIASNVSPSNLLFVHGGNSVGKTHILQAIGIEAIAQNAAVRVRYMTAESFVNGFIDGLNTNRSAEFRFHTRDSVDLLLIDDIGFLDGKDRTQEEFLRVLRHHQECGNRIVVTCDRLPTELKGLNDALRSRLGGGIVFGVDSPELDARRQILTRHAADQQLQLPADVLDYVATNVRTNVTELLGCFTRILSVARNTPGGVNLALAKQQLAKVYNEASVRPTADIILQTTADHYGVRAKDILAKGRTKAIVTPRKVAMYLARSLTPMSFPELGRFFGNRDHSTIMSAFDGISEMLATDAALQAAVQQIERRLGIGRN